MNWAFVVVRDNSVEIVKVFFDYWDGCRYTDNFIKQCDNTITDFPTYHKDEYYKKDNLTIGLYKTT